MHQNPQVKAEGYKEMGSPLLEDAASVHVVMISEQLFMISAGNFCNKWKYFCPLLGAGRAVANCASAV